MKIIKISNMSIIYIQYHWFQLNKIKSISMFLQHKKIQIITKIKITSNPLKNIYKPHLRLLQLKLDIKRFIFSQIHVSTKINQTRLFPLKNIQ